MIYKRYKNKLQAGIKHTEKKNKKQKINKNTTHKSKTSNIIH